MISSVKSEEIHVYIFFQVLIIAIGMHSSKPILKISNRNM
jgi:hypothetical protein